MFAHQIWHHILSPSGWSNLALFHGCSLQVWCPSSRVCLLKHLHKGYDSLVVLISWQLWKECNSRVFDFSPFAVLVILDSSCKRAVYGRQRAPLRLGICWSLVESTTNLPLFRSSLFLVVEVSFVFFRFFFFFLHCPLLRAILPVTLCN